MTNVKNTENIQKIKIVGIGGGGNNAVIRIMNEKVQNVETYLLNTETGILRRANIESIIIDYFCSGQTTLDGTYCYYKFSVSL